MFSANRIFPLLKRGIRCQRMLLPSAQRSLLSTSTITSQRSRHISKGVTTLLVLGGLSGSLYYFFDKTSRFELFEYAREHKNTILKDGSWRSALALGLVDLYKQSGNEVITLMHCGRFLGKVIAGDIQYFWAFIYY